MYVLIMEIYFWNVYQHLIKSKVIEKIIINYFNDKLADYQFLSSYKHDIKMNLTKKYNQFKLKTVGGLKKQSIGIHFCSRWMN